MAGIRNIFAITALFTTVLSNRLPILKRANSGVATFNDYAAQSK